MPRRMTTMYAGRRNIGILSGAAMMILAAGGYQPAHAQVSEGQAVARAGEALIKAMIDIDRGQLEALASDNLSYGHSAGRIENKQQFIDYLVSKASAFRTINLSDQTVSVL